MRRRPLLHALPALALACRSNAGETIAPEDLPKNGGREAARVEPFEIIGPGVRLSLKLPVHLERIGDDPVAPVRIISEASGKRAAMLFAGGDAPPDEDGVHELAPKVWLVIADESTPDAIGSVHEGAPAKAWTLAFNGGEMAWPTELVADVFTGDMPRLELRRHADPRDVMVIVRGPLPEEAVPDLDALVGPSQKERGRGAKAKPPWIELVYEHGEDKWHQRHHRVDVGRNRVMLVTAQATADLAARVIADGDTVAKSLAFTPR